MKVNATATATIGTYGRDFMIHKKIIPDVVGFGALLLVNMVTMLDLAKMFAKNLHLVGAGFIF